MTLMLPAIATVTFYSGAPPLDFLRSRVNEIVQKNPWLEGWLEKLGGRIHVRYGEPKRTSFVVVHDSAIHSGMAYDEMCSRLRACEIRPGNECVGKTNAALFRVAVVVSSPNEFALYVSMSHVLGDGATFYRIYTMLGQTSESEQMIVERNEDFPANLELAMEGGDAGGAWMRSPGVLINLLSTMLFNWLLSRLSRPASVCIHHISPAWIDKQKRKPSATPFLSTNDILTSLLLRLSGCAVGLMAINLRSRVDGCTERHAGNYETVIPYQRADFASPCLIRRSLQENFRRALSGGLPGFLYTALWCPIGLVSNWTTFYRDVELDGCGQVRHLPCVHPSLVVWPMAIIFCPAKGAVALMAMSRGGLLGDRRRTEAALAAADGCA